MQKEKTKFNNNEIFEGMPSISALIKSVERNIGNRKILGIFIDEQKRHSKTREIGFLNIKAQVLNFDINFVSTQFIEEICVGNTHGGIIAVSTPRIIEPLGIQHIKSSGIYYLLEGIEDPYNFGNALRSLYAFGADGIIVGERNWLGVSGTVARASAGTSELLNAYICDAISAIDMFKSCGYKIVCAGIRDSISLFEADLSKPLLVILGGEKRGISRAVLDVADTIVRIDYGNDDFKGSLSASASAAVFGFEILRHNKK